MAYSVTAAMVAWLRGLGLRASTLMPGDAELPYVTVERLQGTVSNMVPKPQFAVQAWAATEAEAEAVADMVAEAALTGEPPRGVRWLGVAAGPYRFFDESTRCPRCQLVLDAAARLASYNDEE